MGSKPQPMGIIAVFSDEPPAYPTCDGEVSREKPEDTNLRLSCATGYGTATHRKALEVYGLTPHHRKSFQILPGQLPLF
jgi:tRNA A37 threonylcarbamoyladenosine dehydratase